MMNPTKIAIGCLAGAVLLFGVIAVSTTHWMEGCFELHEFLNHHINASEYFAYDNDSLAAVKAYGVVVDRIKSTPNGSICFVSGLFHFRILDSRLEATIPHSEEGQVREATAACVIIGMIIQLAGALVALTGNHEDAAGSPGRIRFIVGTIVLVASSLMLLMGGVIYSVAFAKATNGEAMIFFDQFRDGVVSLGMRTKRALDSSNKALFAKEITALEERIFELEDRAQANFGASIYLAWVSFIASFVNSCLTMGVSLQGFILKRLDLSSALNAT